MVTGIALASNTFVSKYDKQLQTGTKEYEEARKPDPKQKPSSKVKRTAKTKK
jgi:hypothetical protein